MSVTGEIKNLYSDKDKTRVLLPRTKTKAVSDENGTSLDVLLEGKAPAGFGLGEQVYFTNAITAIEDLDNLYTTCYFVLVLPFAPVVLNGQTFASAHGRNHCFMDGRVYQELIPVGSPHKIVRTCFNNVWSPWEHVNPPMRLGIEYRTTERYNGKPIYRKAINLGAMPNATIARINHGVENIDFCFPPEGCMFHGAGANNVSFPYFESITNFCSTELQKSGIVIATGGNSSAFNGIIYLKYTKTTD